jgi:hypothetical protein
LHADDLSGAIEVEKWIPDGEHRKSIQLPGDHPLTNLCHLAA